jgi:hypothetical protein
MKNTTKRLMGLLAPAALILAIGCKSKPVEVAPPSAPALNEPAPPQPTSRNVFLGTWVGEDKSGIVYTFRFANNLRWESHIEESGSVRPLYRGTYEPQGARRVLLKVLEEVDLTTFGWRRERGNMPTALTGYLLGSTLKVADVFTEAELNRR